MWTPQGRASLTTVSPRASTGAGKKTSELTNWWTKASWALPSRGKAHPRPQSLSPLALTHTRLAPAHLGHELRVDLGHRRGHDFLGLSRGRHGSTLPAPVEKKGPLRAAVNPMNFPWEATAAAWSRDAKTRRGRVFSRSTVSLGTRAAACTSFGKRNTARPEVHARRRLWAREARAAASPAAAP